MEQPTNRMWATALGWTSVALGAGVGTGCTDVESITALDPEGPPRVLQVFVRERVVLPDDDGAEQSAVRSELAYGYHDKLDDHDGEVTHAAADSSQRIRVVVDELLRGNFLEEIACADGSWSLVPPGTTPTHIARCSGADLSGCNGDHAVCVGAEGPIGILDENNDGAIDDTRFIDGAATLTCGDVDIPLDLQRSYYQPSGNQVLPADPYDSLGIDGLGPAVVLSPREGLRTGATCGISFAATVVDKDGNRVCAPPMGDFDGGCVPGDTSGIVFSVERLTLLDSDPADGAQDVSPSVSPEDKAIINLVFNGALTVPDHGGIIEVRANDVVLADVTVTGPTDQPFTLLVELATGLEPSTDYALHVRGGDDGIADRYGGTMPTDVTLTWRTAAQPPHRR